MIIQLLKFVRNYLFKIFIQVNKRIRFVTSVFSLIGLLIFSTLFLFDKAWIFIPTLIIVTFLLVYISILEGVEKMEWLTLFIMPVLFTVACYSYYFLFIPVRWLSRIPLAFMYGFSLYAILLASNIFNVGVEKSLQLFRAAFSVNYFYQTVTLFLFLSILFWLKFIFILNGVVVFMITFPLALQLLWSIRPKVVIERKIIIYSLLVSLIVAELALVLSFLPLKESTIALFLTGVYYGLTGLIYHYLDERLFKNTVREYIFVIGFVGTIAILSIRW